MGKMDEVEEDVDADVAVEDEVEEVVAVEVDNKFVRNYEKIFKKKTYYFLFIASNEKHFWHIFKSCLFLLNCIPFKIQTLASPNCVFSLFCFAIFCCAFMHFFVHAIIIIFN